MSIVGERDWARFLRQLDQPALEVPNVPLGQHLIGTDKEYHPVEEVLTL